jgi:hypothetical protein
VFNIQAFLPVIEIAIIAVIAIIAKIGNLQAICVVQKEVTLGV